MTTATIVHNIVSISRKVTHFPKFISTRFTLTDEQGATYTFDAFSATPLETIVEPDQIVEPTPIKEQQ